MAAMPAGYGQLFVIWPLVIVLSVAYCSAYQAAHGLGIDLNDSAVWMVQIWSGWMLLSAGALAWRRRSGPIAGGITTWAAAMLVLCTFALGSEWLVNLLFAQLEWLGRWHSFWELFNRRILFCVILSLVLIGWMLRARDREAVQPASSASVATLTLTGRDGPVTVAVDDIEMIQAAENYVQVCVTDGRQFLHRATLTAIAQSLDRARMVRIHRSLVINVDHVCARLPQWRLRLASGKVVSIGRSFRKALPAAIGAASSSGDSGPQSDGL